MDGYQIAFQRDAPGRDPLRSRRRAVYLANAYIAMSPQFGGKGEFMMKQLTRIMGLLLIPAATALAVTSEPPSSALPSATDFSGAMLAERADIVSWKTLGQVTPINENGKIIPQFAESVLALNKQ